MSSVQLSSAGVAAVAFANKGLASSTPSALRVCSPRRSFCSLVVRAATVVTPKVYDDEAKMDYAPDLSWHHVNDLFELFW
jgi:hypothetical protein